jgi:hypothetical protein
MQTMTLERPLETEPAVVGRRPLPRRVSVPRPVSVRGQVIARLCGAEAHELVARSLTQLVEDAFLVAACSPTRHLRDALDQPIAAATEAAVATLIDELDDLLDLMPETASDAWQRARLEADLAFE